MHKVLAVLLGLAVAATFAATVAIVALYTPAERVEAASAPVTEEEAEPLVPPPPPAPYYAFPDLSAAPLGEAIAGLEAAGAQVTAFDARMWERPVQPDWRVCTQSQLFLGDGTTTDAVHLAAVPVGDACP